MSNQENESLSDGVWHPKSRERSPESRARLRATVERLLDFTADDKATSLSSTPQRRRIRPTFFDGEVLAERFRIVRFIASGGVGEVYEAEDIEAETKVALKTVRREVSSDPDIMERFRRELKYARQIDHPNVCRTLEMAEHQPKEGGEPTTFLTMELLEGGTLEDLLAYVKRIDPDQVLPLVEQMVAGLAAAHEAGIVHRDLKSGNVMLVRSGDPEHAVRVVLTDFGLAHGALEDGGSQDASSLTRTGQIIGTPAYMAPEQLRGEKATRATDIYALGLLLYEMVTGARPFPGRNSFASAVRRLEEPPTPPADHLPSLEPAWERTILRCLERNPEDRYDEITDVLEGLLPGEGGDFPENLDDLVNQRSSDSKLPPSSETKNRKWIAPVLIVLLLVVALLTLRACSASQPPTEEQSSALIVIAS